MLGAIQQELEKRAERFGIFDTLIHELFVFEKYARLRRDVVHGALGIPVGDWRSKRLVNEKLLSMGVRKVITDGKRWFVGITWKQTVK